MPPVVSSVKVEAKVERQVSTPKVTATPSFQSSCGTSNTHIVEWMVAAGIAESDFKYVDMVINGYCVNGKAIVHGEGSWNGTTTWNTQGSGAYGLGQALPATKMAAYGSDYMTNPITQLRWANDYAKKYGSWQQAWNFRKCTGYCYSTRTHSKPFKDHTWW